MPIIAIVGNKGGAGKTTLSINFATGLARGATTAIIDADPQGSSFQWRAIGADRYDLIDVYQGSENLDTQVSTLMQDYDNIVIDCPPSVHAAQTGAALAISNIALIPVQPSPMDLWATVHIEEAIANARTINPAMSALLVINQLEKRTTLSRLVRDALDEIELPVAETAIHRRAAYRNSILEGRTIFDIGSRGKEAAMEIDQLILEVIQ